MITVKLYGKFKSLVGKRDPSGTIGIAEIEKGELATIHDVLEDLNISRDGVSHIFLNGEYSKVKRVISDGDRLAIFPKDMGLLYKWYFKKRE